MLRYSRRPASLLLSLSKRNKRPITLAYVDLDNFNNVNDTMGHLYGDELLRRVAQVVTAPQLKACSVTASIGAVSLSAAPDDIDLMIKSADELMYRVKKMGKNHVLVESV